jgi:integrase
VGKKGQRQFGNVRRLGSGRWQARILLSDGRRITAPRTFGSKTDATLWLDHHRAALAAGRSGDPERSRVLLEDFAWEWLGQHTNLAPRTREIYAHQLEAHVLPQIDEDVPPLGEVPLNELTPELIRSWQHALLLNRTRSIAAKAYVRLRQVLNQAVDDERIARNPCRIRRAGAEHHGEQRFASVEELLRLAEAAPERYQAMVLTAGLAGLRQGELLALRRSDLDLGSGDLHVRRKRQQLDSGEVIEGPPKSQAGKRTVALPEPLVDALREHLRRFVASGNEAYVFTAPEGGPIDRNVFRRRVWVPTIEAAGLSGLRFHDLRHTAGTLAARTGATTKELMARLGHASASAALIYQHASAERDRSIAEGLTEMIRDADLGSARSVKGRPKAERGHGAQRRPTARP